MGSKDRRREVRLASSEDDLLVEAAGLAGVSVSEFVLDRALGDAETLVTAHRTIRLDTENYGRLLAALDAPLVASDKLVVQARRARPLKRVD